MASYLPEISISKRSLAKRTILSFVLLILFFIACITAWKWLNRQPKVSGTPAPLRSALYANEGVFGYIFSSNHTSKIFPLSKAVSKPRVNGSAGMKSDLDTANFKLQLIRSAGDTVYISMVELRALPKTDIIFDFKCIEGWSQVTHWGGVRFSDFAARYGLSQQMKLTYTGMHTPDDQYYVGIDNRSMMHPQTILCYEMNGRPLPMDQGAPLRLIIPVKYGVKHIKRLGTMFFSNARPRDYWFEQGYDYYCGL